jgi:hypothetical protein
VLLFQSFRLSHFGFQVRVDLRLIGVIISEGRMYLRQRQMADLPQDLLGNQAHVVPLSDPADRDTGPRNAGSPSTNIGVARDQAAHLRHGAIDFKYSATFSLIPSA